MANTIQPHFEQWFSQGAVYGFADRLTLFWGDAATSATCEKYPSVYSNDFFLENSKPWTHYSDRADVPSLPLETKIPQPLKWEEPNFEVFKQHFELAQQRMRSGELSKIVLATETRAPKNIDPAVFLSNALGIVPRNTHLYGQWNSHSGFLGFTPEILFKLENSHTLRTMALAGTSAVDDADKTLHTEKNLEEHAWVVRDLTMVLEKLGSVHVGPLQTLPLRTLAHLQTSIFVELTEVPAPETIIEALHPTPALGVAPRAHWRDLKELRRGYGPFGAPFVVASGPEYVVAVVGIRQLAWDTNSYYIRCGCGVVKDSRLDEEWQELLLKIQSVKRIFGWHKQ